MFKITAICSVCSKKIEANEEVNVKLRYPVSKGITEIKAYLQNEGTITCMDCFNRKDDK
ncbi:MAG: Fe3+ hydroxamate transporter substrate-binding protein [Haloplasmataceae bacterium]|jgi:hypothetical protein|nr:Fe3+ hydroxamate transporter substrate-binding protein [Haloplasmataceae bacterium]